MRVRHDPATQVVAVEGRLDRATAGNVRHRLHAAIGVGTGDLVLDLSGIDTIDVNGLGVLVGVHRQAHRVGRRLVLREVPPRVMRCLASSRLYRVLRVEPASGAGA
jgi:anti-anti-sigma factor